MSDTARLLWYCTYVVMCSHSHIEYDLSVMINKMLEYEIKFLMFILFSVLFFSEHCACSAMSCLLCVDVFSLNE